MGRNFYHGERTPPFAFSSVFPELRDQSPAANRHDREDHAGQRDRHDDPGAEEDGVRPEPLLELHSGQSSARIH